MKFIVELTQEQYREILNRAETDYGYEADGDFNPMDYSGGNFNDCYQLGMEHADADAAREILDILGDAVE